MAIQELEEGVMADITGVILIELEKILILLSRYFPGHLLKEKGT